MREINVTTKLESLEDITREVEINLSGPIRMVNNSCRIETKSERNHERFIGLAFCSIAHFTGLLRHQGGLHSIHRVSSCATEKYQSEGI